MRIVATLAAIALAGCSTTGTLESTPKFAVQSTRSADALESCIGLALGKTYPPSVLHGESNRTISFGNDLVTLAVVTIEYGQPNRIVTRSKTILNKKWRNRIRECA